jgi:hypothetical protein
MIFSQRFTLRILSRRKLVGGGNHVGLQLPDGGVVDINQIDGTCHRTYKQFERGRKVTVINEFVVDDVAYYQIMQRVQTALTRQHPYHTTKWNCEMLVNWLIGAPVESPTVNTWVVVGLIAGVVATLALAGAR